MPDAAGGTSAKSLAEWQARLAGFDIQDWPVTQQIDWHLVRAEMNGMDFNARVLRPWQRMRSSSPAQPSAEVSWSIRPQGFSKYRFSASCPMMANSTGLKRFSLKRVEKMDPTRTSKAAEELRPEPPKTRLVVDAVNPPTEPPRRTMASAIAPV